MAKHTNSLAAVQAAEATTVPPVTGTDYEHCRCVGALPGRACTLCGSTKWLKRCPKCNGSRITFKNSQSGREPRSEYCGECNGKGWKPCMPADLEAIRLLAKP